MGHTWSRDGSGSSRRLLATTSSAPPPSSSSSSASDTTSLAPYNLSKPRAAVVGGGMAGVHVAYELADLGFDVTLYEQHAQLALGGGTQHTLPFVGVGLLQPSLATLRVRNEWLAQLLAPTWTPCPCLDTRAHRLHTLLLPLRPHVRRWLRGRTRARLGGDEVMWYTDRLSHVSVSAIHALATAYPALRAHVYDGAVIVRSCDSDNSSSNNRNGNDDGSSKDDKETSIHDTSSSQQQLVKTAHPSPLRLRDPVAWTRALAQECVREHGVRLALGTRVERVQVQLLHDVEVARGLLVSREATADNNNSSNSSSAATSRRVYEEHAHDIVVLACGADAARLARPMTQLPLLDLAGCAATIACRPAHSDNNNNTSSATLCQRLQHLFAATTPAATTASTPATSFTAISSGSTRHGGSNDDDAAATLVALAPPCSLYAYSQQPSTTTATTAATMHTDNDDSAAAASSSPARTYVLAGLLSLDTSRGRYTATAQQLLARLQTYAQAWCNVELPLCDAYRDDHTPALPDRHNVVQGDSSNSSSTVDTTASVARVRVSAYARAFSADGVPIVDHCGSLYNTFVCSGFGDHTADMAPGAAKMLRALIERQTHRRIAQAAWQEMTQPQPQQVPAIATPTPPLAIAPVAAAALQHGGERALAQQEYALSLRLLRRSEDDMRALVRGQLPHTLTHDALQRVTTATTTAAATPLQRAAMQRRYAYVCQRLARAPVIVDPYGSDGERGARARMRRLLPLPRAPQHDTTVLCTSQHATTTTAANASSSSSLMTATSPSRLLLNPFAASRFAPSRRAHASPYVSDDSAAALPLSSSSLSSSDDSVSASLRHRAKHVEYVLLHASTRVMAWLRHGLRVAAADARMPFQLREVLAYMAGDVDDDVDASTDDDHDNAAAAQRAEQQRRAAAAMRLIVARHEGDGGNAVIGDTITSLLADSAQRQRALHESARHAA